MKPDLFANYFHSLKANIKLGGVTHRLNDNPKWWGALANTMIVGADVTHPGENIVCPSMAGIVATYDDTAAHYLASARLHKGAQEVSQSIHDSSLRLLLTCLTTST